MGYVYQAVDGFVDNIAPDLFRLRMRGVMTMTRISPCTGGLESYFGSRCQVSAGQAHESEQNPR